MKKLVALLMAAAMLVSLAACGGKDDETSSSTDTSIAENTDANATAQPDGSQPSTDASASEPVSDPKAPTTTPGTPATPENPGTPDNPAQGNGPLASSAEVLAYYNQATAKAVNSKVGFAKKRVADNEKLDAGLAFQTFKGLVYKFMGIGEKNAYSETVTKGAWDADAKKQYLRTSTLTGSDISSATCKVSGDNYILTIKVKDGSSAANEKAKSKNAPIDKSGICVGDEDKGYYDHKTALVMYAAIEGTFKSADIKESYSGATITATINSKTGNMSKLLIEYNIAAIIKAPIGTANAKGTSHITYSDFKW